MRVLVGTALVIALISRPAFSAETKCSLQQMGQLPVTMYGTMPIISGTINGAPARFLVDSGSFFSILSRNTLRRFQLQERPPPSNLRVYGVGGTEKMGMATSKTFSLAGFSGGHAYAGVQFLISGKAFSGGVDGIIGQNVIGNADIEYDLANGFVRLFRPKDCAGAQVVYWGGSTAVAEMPIDDIKPSSPHIVGKAKINGKKINVLFDTGAWRSVLDRSAAAKVGITPENDESAAGGVSGGIGSRTTENFLARFDTLDLGGEVIKNARLRVGDLSTLGKPDMLLGADFFLSHRIYVSSAQNRIFFTYNGGPVFDLRPSDRSEKPQGTASAGAESEPVSAVTAAIPAKLDAAPRETLPDAAAYRRRGMASAVRVDFAGAIADFDQAIKLDPNDAEAYFERGNAHMQTEQMQLALNDYDQTIKLNPTYVAALVTRGAIRLRTNDEAGSRADFEEAMRRDSTGGAALSVAATYMSSGRQDDAVGQLNTWIEAHPKDSRLPQALLFRCRSRALLGKELDLAVADCNSAIKKGFNNSQGLESRAFVYLRQGNYDKSMIDFKAVLKVQPKQAFSMYGLGIVKLKKGMQNEGEQDMQAAVALQPNVAEIYGKAGLSP